MRTRFLPFLILYFATFWLAFGQSEFFETEPNNSPTDSGVQLFASYCTIGGFSNNNAYSTDDDYWQVPRATSGTEYLYQAYNGGVQSGYDNNIYLEERSGGYNGSINSSVLLSSEEVHTLDHSQYYYTIKIQGEIGGSWQYRVLMDIGLAGTCAVGSASDLISSTGYDTLNLSGFTPSGSPTGYVIRINKQNGFTDLVDSFNAPPSASSTTYSGYGQQVVYSGPSVPSDLTIEGLLPNTNYYVKIYPYTACSTSSAFYRYNNAVGSYTITTCGPAVSSASSMIFGEQRPYEINLSSFTASADASGYVIKMNTANSFTVPSDGANLPGASVDYAHSGEQVIYTGTSNAPALSLSGLNPATTYYFKVYGYKSCADNGINYFGAAGLETSQSTCPIPTDLASDVVFHAVGPDSIQLYSFTAPTSGADGYVISINETNSFTTTADGLTLPSANLTYGGGQQVVYVGSSINPDITVKGLTENTTYYFSIDAYKSCNGYYAFNTSGKVVAQLNVKTLPTITFSDVNKNYGDASFDLTATSNSTGEVSYAIVGEGNGTLLSGTNNQTVALGNAGTVTISATVAADADYNTGTKDITLTIDKIDPTISFFDKQVATGDPDVTLSATSNSTGTITYSIEGAPNGNSLSGTNNSVLTIGDVGTATIRATVAEDANYLSTYSDATLTVTSPQTVVGLGYNSDNAPTLFQIVNGGAPEAFKSWSGGVFASMISVGNTLFGSVNYGGIGSGYGGVYKIKKDGTGYTELYDINGTNNYYFASSSLVYANQKLWGLVGYDLSNSSKAGIFSVDTTGANFQVHAYFDNSISGGTNYGELVAAGGKIWGVSGQGGANGYGYLYSIDTDGSNFTNHIDLYGPSFGTAYINGKIYVADEYGPNGVGAIYRIDTDGSNATTLIESVALNDLSCQLVGHGGKVWGIAGYSLFSFDYDGTNFAVEYTISSTYGTSDYSNLTSSAGRLWGMTPSGGANGYGVVYTFEAGTTTFTKITDLTSASGGSTSKITAPVIAEAEFGTPSITFSDQTINYQDTVTLNATSNSTGAFTYELVNDVTGSAIIEGNKLVAGGVGTVTIKAMVSSDQNYTSGERTATYTINKIDPTITFDDLIKTYGDAQFSLMTESNSTGAFTYSLVNDTTGSVLEGDLLTVGNVGQALVQVDQAADDNFIAGTTQALLTIGKATLTVTAADTTKIYGDQNPENRLIYSGFVNGEDETVLNELPVATADADNLSPAGNYDLGYFQSNSYGINLSGGADNSYEFNLQPATLTVEKRPLTVYPKDTSAVYGDDPAVPEILYDGFVNGDDASALDLAGISIGSTFYTGTNVGEQTIYLNGQNRDESYDLTFNTGTYTVTKATLTVSARDVSIELGEAIPTSFTIDYTGFKNGQDQNYLNTKPTAITTATDQDGLGQYPIIPSGAVDERYDFTYVNGTLSINKGSQQVGFPSFDLIVIGDELMVNDLTLQGQPVTYTSSNTNVAQINGNVISFTGAGAVIITASVPESADYQSLTVKKTIQVYNNPTRVGLVGTAYNNSIFSLDASNNIEVLKEFASDQGLGSNPYGSVILSNGKLWGMTNGGGDNNSGVIFQVDIDGSNYEVVHHFGSLATDGSSPYGSLVEFNGKLYGMTYSSDGEGNGLVFSIDTTGLNFSVVHEFDSNKGYSPYGSLIVSNNKLWGMTSSSYDYYGTIFNMDTLGNLKTVHEFGVDTGDGEEPYGDLLQVGEWFYGMTYTGGADGYGTIFRLKIDGTGYELMHDFIYESQSANGNEPYGSLTYMSGQVWGMTYYGGTTGDGTIFKMDTSGANYTTVYEFNSADGSSPYGSLANDRGTLWGMTGSGGTNGRGVIFKLDTATETYTKVKDLGGTVINSNTVDSYPSYGSLLPIYESDNNQTITFEALTGANYGDTLIAVATASSGLDVSFTSSDIQIAVVSNDSIFFVGTGDVTITASQSGDSFWNAATPVDQLINSAALSITVTVDANQSKVYGDTDTSLTYTVTSGSLVGGDTFTGALSRATGEDASTYAISQGTLDAGSNYSITFVGDDFTIVAKPIEVTADTNQTKVYGDTDPVFTYTVTSGALESGDSFTGALDRAAGEDVGTYAINQGTLNAGTNYDLTFVSNDFNITKASQTIDFPDFTTYMNVVDSLSVTLPEFTDAGLTITYTSSSNPVVASISGNMITFDRTQMTDYSTSIVITASQSGNAGYGEATSIDRTLYILEEFVWDGNSWNETPAETSYVGLYGDWTLDQDYTFKYVYVNTGYTLTIPDGLTLTTTSSMDTKGTTIIKSGGSMVTLGELFGTDNYQVERNTTFDINTGRYSIVGSPMKLANFSQLGNSAVVYGYDETQAYNVGGNEGADRFKTPTQLSQTTMQPGHGYFSAFTGDGDGKVTFIGTPNTGTINVDMSYTDQGDAAEVDYQGFNLVSNPYPSAISYTSFMSENSAADISGSIYLWDDYGSDTGRGTNADYLIVNAMGNTDSRGGADAKWDGYIRSGQGFFVQANSATSLTFNNTMRQTGGNSDGGYYRLAPVTAYKLILSDGAISKATVLGYASDATLGIDKSYDALNMNGGGLQVYTLQVEDGKKRLSQ